SDRWTPDQVRGDGGGWWRMELAAGWGCAAAGAVGVIGGGDLLLVRTAISFDFGHSLTFRHSGLEPE
ncbi:hypothetical protein, partial [Rhizobium sp. Leaf311]|uniref:hypothetical protein n=1 Tax=Rhizobium sp. Leaf311 TaxID=1736332 RepID=UPI001AEC94B5